MWRQLPRQRLHLRLHLLRLTNAGEARKASPFLKQTKTNKIFSVSLYTLSSTKKLPVIKQPAGLTFLDSADAELLSLLGNTSVEDVTKRLANDHLAFVAYLHSQPAAFGWMARGKATIGELNHSLVLPLRHRYLWNFRTLAAFRGLGIYPALLQHMIQYEGFKAKQFWIIHAPENKASLSGIVKAGFQYVGKLYTNAEGKTAIDANEVSELHKHSLAFMDIALSHEATASCWNCSSPYLKKRSAECCCTTAGSECTLNNMLSMAF
ncbi:MAG TPA: N-acetyltransferase [Flavisolibacter sp.]|nr:N-acetyltransferase [Flavisolibacter sp.]